mmetsp:Transcript_22210/g.40872  ORF Transcript_22210/g.40872 Transcript_22210/m.40872 type:complete len:229 (+) Transcript_22210:51-737(+)
MEDLLVSGDDVRDIIYGDGEAYSSGGYDGDMELDVPSRRKLMTACVRASHGWMERREGTELEAIVGGLRSQPGGERLSPDEALSSLVFAGVLACYRSVETDQAEQLLAGYHLSDEQEEEFFSPTAAPWRPRRDQFEMLEEVMQEESQRRASSRGEMDTINILGSGMSPAVKVAYLSVVIAAFVATLFWAMRRLFTSRYINPHPRERSAKAERKVEKSKKDFLKGKLKH